MSAAWLADANAALDALEAAAWAGSDQGLLSFSFSDSHLYGESL
jgi:hypothetical protein